MAQALRLAEGGLYSASPNPRVGCVIVRDGQVVGEGWHERAGTPHAEIHALQKAGERMRGATVYVTLEPCSHHGRTPPCADALIAADVARVVAAMRDPNPLVAGQGMARLARTGIQVEIGLMEAQAQALNIGFISRMITVNWLYGGEFGHIWKTGLKIQPAAVAFTTGRWKWDIALTLRVYPDKYTAADFGLDPSGASSLDKRKELVKGVTVGLGF